MTFSDRVLVWHEKNARRDLPWQREPTAYRVWVSEIMLQQTRVITVIEYFQRFMSRFPTVRDLATADLDRVLELWSGLGYYARARNLHRTAGIIHEEYRDRFPPTFDVLSSLPGIGRSTAGAILALAFGQRHAILDGNVKRVLARHYTISGWPGNTAVSKRLWGIAEQHTPDQHVARYTQAMMDLGATVCTRTRPACDRCPLRRTCLAHAREEQERFPTKRSAKPLPVRATNFMLILCQDSSGHFVLLEKRPPTGIWGGLWSFPECPPGEETNAWCRTRFGNTPISISYLPPFRHTFTHFHLDIQPVLVGMIDTKAPKETADSHCGPNAIRLDSGSVTLSSESTPTPEEGSGSKKKNSTQGLWYPLTENAGGDRPPALGIAAPVARLLRELASHRKEVR